MRGFRRRIARGLAVAVAASLMAAVASASAATSVKLTGEIDEPRFYVPAKVKITADDSANVIEVGFDRGRGAFVITDRERIVAPQCRRLGRTSVRCTHDNPDAIVVVDAEGGNDEVAIAPSVQTGASVLAGSGADLVSGGALSDGIKGGKGPDRLIGRGGVDSIDGLSGRDTVRGNGGNDFLDGGDDRDVILGGPGGDDLYAGFDGDADRRLECGPGSEDFASVGENDPKPLNCENVIRVDS